MEKLNNTSDYLPAELRPAVAIANKYIYLFNKNDTDDQLLHQQLSQFNYPVKTNTNISLDALKDSPISALPSAIIMDIDLLTDSNGEKIQKIRESAPLHIPLIFFTNRNSFQARLKAVRASGDAFFVNPINIITLVTKLDILCAIKPLEIYRILIIEDMVSLSNYYAAILQQAGMQTYILNNPVDILQGLAEFRPDIILLDIYMPECNGYELATVIRQQENYLSIPLVFLSSEKDKMKQLNAMSLGGDDFLTKPVVPEHLIKLVSYRVQRARLLRSLIMKDSLTGLFNHNAIQEQIKIEIAQADRHNTKLTIAMLDLDHFKTINDTYGHIIGDMVLNNLCRLIIKRLRKSDIAGRYGGEEFILIFTDTSITDAQEICNDIRTSFANFEHDTEKGKFTITLSCGLAEYPEFPGPIDLIIAADNALYQAKENGRNQVVMAKKIIE